MKSQCTPVPLVLEHHEPTASNRLGHVFASTQALKHRKLTMINGSHAWQRTLRRINRQGVIPRDSQRSTGADQAARSHHGRPEIHGFSRGLAAFLDPRRRARRGDVRGGDRFRRFQRRGLAAINEADLLVVPQPETALVDPFTAQPTLTMICNIHDPITHQDYTRDPRNIARKAVSYMRSTGLADVCLLAPELEFFIFDNVRFEQREHEAFYHVDSTEGAWNRGQADRPNLGYKPGSGLGYFPCPPTDSLVNLRSEMAQRMAECGITTAAHFHEVATGGQCEIDLNPQDLVESADQVMMARLHHPQRRAQQRQDGHLHAQAPLRRQRLGHAHAPDALEGRRAAPGRSRLRGHERPRPARHRRSPQARPGALRVRQPHDQQLQAA